MPTQHLLHVFRELPILVRSELRQLEQQLLAEPDREALGFLFDDWRLACHQTNSRFLCTAGTANFLRKPIVRVRIQVTPDFGRKYLELDRLGDVASPFARHSTIAIQPGPDVLRLATNRGRQSFANIVETLG
jgi:hypothetical protein